MTALLHRQFFHIELTNRNDGQGRSWRMSANDRVKFRKRLQGYRREPFEAPVDVVLTRVLGRGQRLWDPDSIGRGNAKQLIDTLTELGWWHDDGPKYIRHVDYRQDDTRRQDGPAVLVEVFAI